MFRKLICAALLAAGAFPLVWALRIASEDPRRAAVIAALALLGILLNLVSLARDTLLLRPWLRALALAVTLVLLVAVVGGWAYLKQVEIPRLPRPAADIREHFDGIARNLLVVAATLAYVGVSILLLPRPPRARATPPPPQSG